MSRRMEVIRGDDCQFELTFVDIDGDPIDLTGATIYLTVKKNLTDSDDDAVINKSYSSFSDPTSGVTVIDLSHTDTSIPVRGYYFDIQVEDASNKITSTRSGRFIVYQDVRTDVDSRS